MMSLFKPERGDPSGLKRKWRDVLVAGLADQDPKTGELIKRPGGDAPTITVTRVWHEKPDSRSLIGEQQDTEILALQPGDFSNIDGLQRHIVASVIEDLTGLRESDGTRPALAATQGLSYRIGLDNSYIPKDKQPQEDIFTFDMFSLAEINSDRGLNGEKLLGKGTRNYNAIATVGSVCRPWFRTPQQVQAELF